MRKIQRVLLAFVLWQGTGLASAAPAVPAAPADAFESASRLYRDAKQDRSASVLAFRNFIDQFPRDPRVADAHFLIGECQFTQAREVAKTPANALQSLKEAEKSFNAALKAASDDGLKSSTVYRLAEIAYNQQSWAAALERFQRIESEWPKSYLVQESLLGQAWSHLALGDFAGARQAALRLNEKFPAFLERPDVQFLQGVLALEQGNAAEADGLFSRLDTPEARYFLAKAHLASGKPLLAATLLGRLARDPDIDEHLQQAASFFLGDAFFLARDHDGAIVKYRDFLKRFPFSQFKVAAMYRIASAQFEKRSYGEARLSFGQLISQHPSDPYAPLARYLIGESHLVLGQMREALFAYSKLLAESKESSVTERAMFRLAWTQQAVGELAPAVQTCETFLARHAGHALANPVRLILANTLARLERSDEALLAFQSIVDAAPGTDIAEQALYLMFKTQYDLGRHGSILTSYQFITRRLPPSRSSWRSLADLVVAEAYVASSQVEDARKIYQGILEMFPNEIAALYARDGLAWCDGVSGRHADALASRQKLREELQKAADLPFAKYNDLGMADGYFHQKLYTESYPFYEKFAKEHPSVAAAPAALHRAGLSLYHLRYYTQAMEVWKRLVALHPASEQAQTASLQIADTLFRAGQYGQAAEAYQTVIDRYPKSGQLPLAHLRLAQTAYQQKRDAQALQDVQQLLFKFPAAPEATDALDLAEAVFDRAPQLDFVAFFREVMQAGARNPQDVSAAESQFRLARRLFEKGDFAAAAPELQRFSVEYTHHASLPKAQLLLGESLSKLGKPAEAAAAFDRFVQSYPEAEEAAFALLRAGSAHYAVEDFEKAATAFERVTADHPGSEYAAAARFNLSLAYKALKDWARAESAYARYAEQAADPTEKLAALWEVFTIQKDRKEHALALKTLDDIRKHVSPDGAEALEVAFRTGEIHLAMGDAAQGLAHWQKTVSMKPADSPFRLQAMIRLAENHEQGARWADALALYQDLATQAGVPQVAQAARERIQFVSQQQLEAKSAGPAKEKP